MLLENLQIMNLTEPGDYTDGPDSNGLFVRVRKRKNGDLVHKWHQNIYIKDPDGKKATGKRTISLRANFPDLSLKEARKLAKTNKKRADQGIDPTDVEIEDEEPEEQDGPPTFREVAEEVYEADSERFEKGKLSKGRLRDLRGLLDNHILPTLGDKQIDEISRTEIFDLVKPIFDEKYRTFQDTWGYTRKVFLHGRKRSDKIDNPVDDTVISWLGKSGHQVKHIESVPYHLVGEAMTSIRSITGPRALSSNLCLLLVILTSCRGKEARLMTWDQLRWKEIESAENWNEKADLWDPVDWHEFYAGDTTKTVVWFIPGENTKTGQPRRLPMSTGCLDLLREARPLHENWGSDLVFPSPIRPHRALGRSILRDKCKQLGLAGTTHGFRTSLRNWWGEVSAPGDAGEIQIGHELGQVKRAYLRTDLLAERAEVMEAWAQYLRGELPDGWKWTGPSNDELLEKVVDLTKQISGLTTQVEIMTSMISEADNRASEAQNRAEAAEKEAAEYRRKFARLESEMRPTLSL